MLSEKHIALHHIFYTINTFIRNLKELVNNIYFHVYIRCVQMDKEFSAVSLLLSIFFPVFIYMIVQISFSVPCVFSFLLIVSPYLALQ